MILNRHNRFLMNAADSYRGSSKPAEGLSARLDAALAAGDITDGQPAPGFQVSPPTAPVAEPAPTEPAPEPAKPKEQESQNPPEEQEEEEEFPTIGGKPKEDKPEDQADFNEADFDRETEDTAKSLNSEEASRKFKELRQELKGLKKGASVPDYTKSPEYQRDQQELVDLRKIKDEVTALRQRNQDLLKVNDEVAVRESDEFQNLVVKPTAEIQGIITQMAEHHKLDEKQLFAIILEQDIIKQDQLIESMVDSIGTRAAGRLGRLADDYKSIIDRRDGLLANAQQSIGLSRKAQEEANERDRQARATEYGSAARGSFEKYASRVPGLVDSSGQLTDQAKSLQGLSESFHPDDFSTGDLGFMAFTAQVFPLMRKQYLELQRENSDLKAGKKTTKTGEGNPNLPKREPAEDPNKPKGLTERMAEVGEFTFSPNTVY